MAKDWTYSAALASDLDRVRFLVGDVKEQGGQVNDSTIKQALTLKGDNIYRAAAFICDGLSARFIRIREKKTNAGSTGRDNVSRMYRKLAIRYRLKATTSASFIMPSMSETTKQVNREDTDVPQAAARRGIHDNPQITSDPDSSLDT